jgi:Transposase
MSNAKEDLLDLLALARFLAFIHSGITNAGSEGTNRVIKTIARDAYGFRNPANQRLRTRCATTRLRRHYAIYSGLVAESAG